MPTLTRRAILQQRLTSGQIRAQALSYAQRELWESSPVAVADMANHICCIIEVRGKATAEHCEAALRQVVERQDTLRMSFLPGKERPLQVIRPNGPVNFRARVLAPGAAVEEMAAGIFREPFDLVQGPLYRVVLLSRSEDDHVLVFAIHHAIADGWTLGVFVQELCIAYIQHVRGITEALPKLTRSYTAWAADERALWQPAELAARADFWKARLAGHRRLWNAHEGPHTATGAHQRIICHFPAELVTAARDLARGSGVTLFTTLLGAFQVAFARWANTDDVLVGTPMANRNKSAFNETMGYFAGIVPIRSRLDPALSFTTSLRALHETTADCFANAMPFVELAHALGDPGTPGHNPVFEVRFALQNHPVPDMALPGLSAKLRMRSTGTARCHLACEITEEADQLEVVWLFRPKLFPQADVENLHRMFRLVLAAACRAPETTIAALTHHD